MPIRLHLPVLLATLAGGLPAAVPAGPIELYVHGHIYTGDPRQPWAEAMAVRDGDILAVGSDRTVGRSKGARAAVVDLQGRTVIPGIVDSHAHLLYGAYALHGLNLSTPESSVTPDQDERLVAALAAYAAAHPRDPILFARADFSTVPPTTPLREQLDRAVPDRPVVVHNTSEHALWLNSAAFRLAGVTDRPVDNPVEERGIVRNASGHPTGVILEAGMQVVGRAVAAQLAVDDQLTMLREATRYLNSYGITSVVNATGDLAELALYARLHERGELTVRTRTSFGAVAVAHELGDRFLAELDEARRRYHDDWVSANLVKFFADGSTGLVPPLVYDPAAYERLVFELDARGYSLMTHAIRSDSVRLALDTYERLEAAHGPRDRRLRIEHADVVEPADVPRFAALGVIADMQPSFCCGPEGLNYDPAHAVVTDRYGSIAASGAVVAFSSDWPCTWPPDPFVGMQEAVTRQVWKSADTDAVAGGALDGAAQGGARLTGGVYGPEERMSLDAALAAYTRGGAYAAGSERRVGTLEAGKAADFAVLSADPFRLPPDQISSVRVLETRVAGKLVYQAAR